MPPQRTPLPTQMTGDGEPEAEEDMDEGVTSAENGKVSPPVTPRPPEDSTGQDDGAKGNIAPAAPPPVPAAPPPAVDCSPPNPSIPVPEKASDVVQKQPGTSNLTPIKLTLIVVGALLVAVAINFGLTTVAVQNGKDVKVDNGKLVSTDDGSVLETASSEVVVTSAGILASKQCSTSGTCNTPVSVTQSKVSHPLSSVIPDSLLQGLKSMKLAVTDQSLFMDVSGVMRVETPGSQCGTVVNVFTNLGMLTLDDSSISVDTELEGHLSKTGFSLYPQQNSSSNQQVHASGIGYFTHIENYARICTQTNNGPKFFEKPYRAQMTQHHPCHTSDLCVSIFKDANGHNLNKAGFEQSSDSIVDTIDTYESTTHILRLVKLPNHPTQTWVEVVDFANSQHFSYALDADGTAHSCTNKEAPDGNFFAFSLNGDYTVGFLGYKAGPGARSLREYHMIPKEETNPVSWVYTEFVDNGEPHTIDVPNANDLDLDTGTTVVNTYTKTNESYVTSVITPYLNKVCVAANATSKPLVTEDALTEELPTVLYYINKINEEFNQTVPFPYASVTSKYGTYWSTLLALYHANPNFYVVQGLASPPSTPDARPAANASNSSRRLARMEEDRELRAGRALLNRRLVTTTGGNALKETSISLKSGCSVTIGYGGFVSSGSTSICFSFESDNTCGKEPPGWYTYGYLGGCYGENGQTTITGTPCVGYTWDIGKSITLSRTIGSGWVSTTVKKKSSFTCSLTGEVCPSVSFAYSSGVPSATFSAQASIHGACSLGASVKVSGTMKLTAGPCGAGLDNRAKLELKPKATLKIGPFKGSVTFSTINMFDEDITDCAPVEQASSVETCVKGSGACSDCVESQDSWCKWHSWDSICEATCCGPTWYASPGCSSQCSATSKCR